MRETYFIIILMENGFKIFITDGHLESVQQALCLSSKPKKLRRALNNNRLITGNNLINIYIYKLDNR